MTANESELRVSLNLNKQFNFFAGSADGSSAYATCYPKAPSAC